MGSPSFSDGFDEPFCQMTIAVCFLPMLFLNFRAAVSTATCYFICCISILCSQQLNVDDDELVSVFLVIFCSMSLKDYCFDCQYKCS